MPFQLTHFQCVCINMSSKEQEGRKKRKASKHANSQRASGLTWGAWLVIITVPWICSPVGKHYLAHGKKGEVLDFIVHCSCCYTRHDCGVVSGGVVLCLTLVLFSPWSWITTRLCWVFFLISCKLNEKIQNPHDYLVIQYPQKVGQKSTRKTWFEKISSCFFSHHIKIYNKKI